MIARVAAAVGVVLGTAVLAAPPAAAAPGPPDAPQYWFDDWEIPALWSAGVRGQGVVIAEIDTGVNASIPELRGQVVRGTDLGDTGDGRVDRSVDEFGHGTAMASVMVARPGLFGIAGLAPAAKVLPIAIPLNGTTDEGGPDVVPQAIRYAADHGAKVISMSIGERRSPDRDTTACPDDEQAAIFHALRKGAVVVAAVGNTGAMHGGAVEPGVCLGVVSVGAVDSRGRVASFSGRAPYLTLVAPGVDVASLSRIRGRAYAGEGTSQATALTAAGIALVWSHYPKASGQQVVGRVLATLADRRSAPSDAYGYGRLDVRRAVTARLPAHVANPVYAAAAPFLSASAASRSLGPAPAPAARGATAPGRYAIDAHRRDWLAAVLTGAGVALAGLLLLAGLLAGAAVARRRRVVRRATTFAVPVTPTPVPSLLAGEPVHPADDGVQRGPDDRL